MTNAKIRHWIYVAIGFLILCGAAFFLFLRESKYTDDSAASFFAEHQSAYEEVVSYMRKKEIAADVKDIPTIDNRYGILPEDTDAYRAFLSAVTELMNTDVNEIISDGETVQFLTKKSGGFLNQNYFDFAYGDPLPTINGAPRNDMPQKKWYYYICTGKE